MENFIPIFRMSKNCTLWNWERCKKWLTSLTDKVLNLQVIEKPNVYACYHECTINALEYYSNNGFPQSKDTARFSKIIREWFNVVDVRNPEHGKRKRIIQYILFVRMIDMILLVISSRFMNGYSIGMTFMVSNKDFSKRHLT